MNSYFIFWRNGVRAPFFFFGSRQEGNSTWYPEIEEPIKLREKHCSLVLYILNSSIRITIVLFQKNNFCDVITFPLHMENRVSIEWQYHGSHIMWRVFIGNDRWSGPGNKSCDSASNKDWLLITGTVAPCIDKSSRCEYWSGRGYCQSNAAWMKENCPCGHCAGIFSFGRPTLGYPQLKGINPCTSQRANNFKFSLQPHQKCLRSCDLMDESCAVLLRT